MRFADGAVGEKGEEALGDAETRQKTVHPRHLPPKLTGDLMRYSIVILCITTLLANIIYYA